MFPLDRLLRRTPAEIARLQHAAVERESGHGGLFGTTWDGGDYIERAEARREFSRYWCARYDAAVKRTNGS